MKLDFAFLADAATIANDGLFAVVGGGFDLVWAGGFPATKSAMALVGRVVFEASEFGTTHQLHGEIIGPDGIVIPPDMWLSINPIPHRSDPQRQNWMTICLNYQGVTFPTPGDYSIRLSIGSQILGQVTIEVVPKGDQT